jgi:Tfp pilus assembly PilM family ATPase
MKITSKTADKLELKEGGGASLFIGGAFIVAGAFVEIYLRNSNAIAIWIGLGLVVVGIVVMLLSSTITVNADRANGQLFYQKKRLIGTKNTAYAIADIFRIETRKQWQMQNAPPNGDRGPTMQQPILVAQSVIVFKDGSELALDHQKNSSSTSVGGMVLMGGQGAETAIAAQVADFLQVPFQEIAPPNMGIGINIIGS